VLVYRDSFNDGKDRYPMKRPFSKLTSIRKPIVALVATGVALLGGVAFATWTATGTGNGFAKATTAQPLTFDDISATVSATLFPGASNVNYSYQIHNPNPYAVTVTGVTSGNAVTVVSQTGTGCTTAASGVTYTAPTGTLNISVQANGDSAPQTFAGASMSDSSIDACQGAVFGLSLTATGTS
jgi:hypothetical protein